MGGNIFIISAIVFVLGLIVGSFLNSIIYRLDDIKSIFTTRSHCPKCRKTLAWYDLIPVVSYLLLFGKCRYCGKTISWIYPFVEIFTGLFFLLTYWNFGITSLAILIAITGCGMIVIFVKDMVNSIIPDEIVIPLILLWLVIIVILFIKQSIFHVNIEGFLSPTKLIIAGGIGAILPAILVLVSHEKWMGMGDLKLSLLIGFSVGYPRILISLFFAYIFGAIAGLILIAARKKTMKQQIPFGPFLVAGWIIGLFAGKLIINWYLNYGYI